MATRLRCSPRTGLAGLALVGLLPMLTACGGGAAANDTPAAPAQRKDAQLAALLPDAVKKSGRLTVAGGQDYPPLVQLGSDNKTVVGMEPDLMKAIAQVLGVDVTFSKASFDSIIAGVQSRRYDLAIQAMLDKPARQQFVTFVDYFRTSSSILADQSIASKVASLDDLCGHAISVEQGTAQVDDVQQQAAKCTKAGKQAIKVLVFPNSLDCFQALSTKRADAFVGGSPTIVYQAKQSNGQLKQVGQPYRFQPYGILVNKQDQSLAKAIRGALQKLIDNGTYGKILEKWGVQSGAIGKATVNGNGA